MFAMVHVEIILLYDEVPARCISLTLSREPGVGTSLRTYDDFPMPQYRTSLEYWWQQNCVPLIAIGLNPSTATRRKSDPTVTRCAVRAVRVGAGGLIMLNLFPYVDKNPTTMWKAPPNARMLCANNEAIRRTLANYPDADVLYAPGGHNCPIGSPNVDRYNDQAESTLEILLQAGRRVLCLGLRPNGEPYHPSRRPYTQEMVVRT